MEGKNVLAHYNSVFTCLRGAVINKPMHLGITTLGDWILLNFLSGYILLSSGVLEMFLH